MEFGIIYYNDSVKMEDITLHQGQRPGCSLEKRQQYALYLIHMNS